MANQQLLLPTHWRVGMEGEGSCLSFYTSTMLCEEQRIPAAAHLMYVKPLLTKPTASWISHRLTKLR